jgi:hypothetical protein
MPAEAREHLDTALDVAARTSSAGSNLNYTD